MVRITRRQKHKKMKYKRTKRTKRNNRKRSKRIRGGNRIGGNNIGANCNDPNFSIFNTNLLKLFPYKGGNLDVNDIYKNQEGPQY